MELIILTNPGFENLASKEAEKLIKKKSKIYPSLVYLEADEKYIDTIRNSQIAIKKLPYAGKKRKIMIAYIIEGEDVKIKTIYPEKEEDIKKRVKNGRWIKL